MTHFPGVPVALLMHYNSEQMTRTRANITQISAALAIFPTTSEHYTAMLAKLGSPLTQEESTSDIHVASHYHKLF